MSVTAVTLTCPHCAARYRVRIDLDKLRKVRSQAQCSHCLNTFDMGSALQPIVSSQTPAQGILAPEIGTTTPPMGIRAPISGAPTPAQGIRRPPSLRSRRSTPVRSRTPIKPTEPTPVVSVLPDADTLGRDGAPEPLVLSDIPAATSEAVLDTLPSGEWLARALLPIEKLQREPSAGEVALERLLGD